MRTQIKTILLVVAALFAMTCNASARSWRINNDKTKMPDFIDINAAMSSAEVVAGDTLYLDPGCNLSDNQTVSKRVTIIGCGYTGRPTQPYGIPYISGILYLRAANTKVMGLYFTNTTYIGANYVTIERCRFAHIKYYSNSVNCQYATIRNCYMDNTLSTNSDDAAICGISSSDVKSAFWTIENCVIYKHYTISSSVTNYAKCISQLYNATIRNNLIINNSKNSSNSDKMVAYCLSNISNSQIINNIIIQTIKPANAINGVNTDQLNNNVLSSNTRPEFNKTGFTTVESVLTGDYQEYELTEDSPARGYGQDGKDCGIFGGMYPYVKGGMPYGHPYFNQYTVSSRPEDGKVNVSLKISVQDE